MPYIVARALYNKGVILVGIFVFVPALLCVPLYDMSDAIRQQSNQIEISRTAMLGDQIPADVTIVGEPVFWFALHSTRNYIGWTGISYYARVHDLPLKDTLQALNPHTVICWQGYVERCAAVTDTGLFAPATEFVVGEDRYWIFRTL